MPRTFELTARPTEPSPKIATLDPACTLAVFHAAPSPSFYMAIAQTQYKVNKISLQFASFLLNYKRTQGK